MSHHQHAHERTSHNSRWPHILKIIHFVMVQEIENITKNRITIIIFYNYFKSHPKKYHTQILNISKILILTNVKTNLITTSKEHNIRNKPK